MEIVEETPLQVGDPVKYIPHRIHALRRDATGEYPWAIGRKSRDGKTVEELAGQELHEFIAGVQRLAANVARRQPVDQEATEETLAISKQVILIRPNRAWDATVEAVHDDGTCDIAVHGANSCITIHNKRVKRDQTGTEAHTFHVGEPTGS